jgi:integrase
MNNLLTRLRPDQAESVQSFVDNLTLEGVHTREELQLVLEAELDWRPRPPEKALALRKLIADLDSPSSDQQPSSVATLEVVDKFLTSKRAGGLQSRSLGNYRQVLHSFARQHPTLPSSPEEIEALLTSKASGSTRLWVYRVLSVLYKFVNQRFGIPNIMLSVQKPRVKAKEPECLTNNQAKAVLDAIKSDRERALVYLYLGQGLRLSEALRLDIQDVGEDVLRIKGKERDESMPLLPEVRDALLKLAGNRSITEPIFVGQQGRLGIDMAEENIKRLFLRAGVAGVQQSPKIFRSTFASMALAAGCDFYLVKRLLRHSRGWDVTDRHYIRLSNEELRKTLEKYSPLRLLNQHSDKLLEGKGSQRRYL